MSMPTTEANMSHRPFTLRAACFLAGAAGPLDISLRQCCVPACACGLRGGQHADDRQPPAEQVRDDRRGHRLREEESLAEQGPDRSQGLKLRLGLDAFGDNLESKAPTKLRDRLHQLSAVGVD